LKVKGYALKIISFQTPQQMLLKKTFLYFIFGFLINVST